MSVRLDRLARAGLATAFAAAILPAAAQNYPEPRRPVTIIVPYAPGGATDTAASLIAARLEREFNATFQVINRAPPRRSD